MAIRRSIHCTLCGFDVKPQRIGLTDAGVFDVDSAPVHALSLRVDDIGGRGRLKVTKEPLPLPFAYGMRDALKAALARVNAEIAEAGGEPDVDE